MNRLGILLFPILSLIPFLFSWNPNTYIYLDYFSAVLFSAFLLYLFRDDKVFFIINFNMIFALYTTLIISLIVEHGVYLAEVQEYTYALGITFKATFASITFLTATYYSYNFFSRSNLYFRPLAKNNEFFIFGLFRIFISLSCFLIILLLLKYGFPSALGVHRADYWSYYAPSWGGVLCFWVIQLSFILGYMYGVKKRKIDLILLILTLFTIILAGERFTGILQVFMYFIIPVVILLEIRIKLVSFKNVFFSSLLIVLLLGVVLNSYSNSVSQNSKNEDIVLRLVLQPQMWWALDKITNHEPQTVDVIASGFLGLTDNIKDKGVNYLMYQVAPKSIVDYRVETGSSFTASVFFGNYYYFGYILGFIVNIICALFFGAMCWLLYLSIVSGNIVVTLIVFKLFIKIVNLTLRGDATLFFSLNTFVLFMIMLFFISFKSYHSKFNRIGEL
ncbi:DUF6418 domain-containing protein [Acinetobacter baumannii]|uniref:DUF6418 domain-containing protein n=1 Tax=Acinetobacter baumannii TaxID=470 RepID=UPI001EFC6056|nr:DUF6418 domain-containing protein [Acinetobacter baumannii]MCG9239467.1 DUF6418 domain-containing protein [Acinetobacter baumannii]